MSSAVMSEMKEQLLPAPTTSSASNDVLYEEVEVDLSDDDSDDLLSTPLPSLPPSFPLPLDAFPTSSDPASDQLLTQQFIAGLKEFSGRDDTTSSTLPLFVDLPPPALPSPTESDIVDPFTFISTLLLQASLPQSLLIFQSEWASLVQSSPSSPPPLDLTPDLHLNRHLHSQVTSLTSALSASRAETSSLHTRLASLSHQRDFHRLHHRRVLDEKARMERDLRRLEAHYSTYDGLMARMKKEVERGQKERMMTKIDKEKMRAQIRKLEDDLARSQADAKEREAGIVDATLTQVAAPQAGKKKTGGKKAAAAFPPPPSPVNPLASLSFPSPSTSSLSSLSLTKTFPAHQAAVSCLAFHPTKAVLATGADDATWKLWGTPRGELIMTGEGHRGWVSDLKFVGDRGHRLITGGGDGAVKLWDLLQAECVETYGGGGGGGGGVGEAVVWGVDVHHTGDLCVAAYLDASCRVFDLATGATRATLRGHGDAVNAVAFLPYSSTLLSASADHTLAVFDLRAPSPSTPQAVWRGHSHAVLGLCLHPGGVGGWSCDAGGALVQWDVRRQGVVVKVGGVEGAAGLYDVAVERGGAVVVTGGEDGVVRVWDAAEGMKAVKELRGHEGRVDAVAWDPSGAYIVSGGADNTWRIWA